jgi:peptidoglycan/xylan/chitin deacetylase (PgdA/CDA1 family)
MSAFDVSPARLRLKKAARRMAVRLGRSIGAPAPVPGGSVRVLTYHRFGHSALDPCCLEPQAFDEHLDWLSVHASVLTPEDFAAVMSGALRAPRDAVLITIDDGHQSVATHALPALDRRGLKAVLFVCPLLATAGSAWHADPDQRFMSWSELADAASRGHTIAPHGDSHRSLGRMPITEAIDEIDRACEALASNLFDHWRSPFFSFPFGTRADYSEALTAALAERGFRFCFTSVHGRCVPGSHTVLMPRIKIEGGNELDLFPDIVRGRIDHWRFVDNVLYLLQQRGRM